MAATWFTIRRRLGREIPSLYYDHLPEGLTRKLPRDPQGQPIEAPELVYALRLDRLPEDSEWRVLKTLAKFAQLYAWHRDHDTLPPQNIADPPRDKEPARALLGHREFRRAVGRHPDLPPEADDDRALQPRPGAGAYIPADRLEQ